MCILKETMLFIAKKTNKWLYVILDFIGGYVNHSFQCVLL